ncbi:MAG: AAA family ATPase, partial [Candidatus Promineifilaceae bacterium]|nr:AAA family ATPase [Candidatus Promineifilaceae bacterium]
MSLRIQLLGTIHITSDDNAVDLPGNRPLALLAYLLITGRAHSRDHLTDLLFDGPADPRAALRWTLSKVRKAIGSDYILANRREISFNFESDYWLDVSAFSAGELELFQGDLLEGLHLRDAHRFDDWLFFEREQLRGQYESGLKQRLVENEGRGDYSAVITVAHQLLQLDNLREDYYFALMGAYARLGKRETALSQYHKCRQVLAEELGVEPAAETTALFEQIRNGTLGRESGDYQSSPGSDLDNGSSSAGPRKNNLPVAATSFVGHEEELAKLTELSAGRGTFVGRDEEMARLEDHLTGALNGNGRTVLISGEAGYGKTTLMTEFARHVLDRYPNLIVAGGKCEALTGTGTGYFLFRDTLAQLTCDLESPGQSFLFSRDQARRLWSLLPHASLLLVNHGSNLIDVLVSGARLRERILAHSIAAERSLVWLDALAQKPVQPREVSQRRLFEEYIQFLRALAERQPLLLLLDDLQWIDHASADLLFYMVRRLTGSRILLLGSYRRSEVVPSHLSGLVEEDETETHGLRPLLQELRRRYGDIEINLDQSTPQMGRAFVDALLDSEPNTLTEPFRDELFQRTRGQPLFTVELLLDMQERGYLVRDDHGRWAQCGDINWEELPVRVEAVISGRIGHLPAALQEALKIASVEGDSFTAEVVARILGITGWEMVQLLSGIASRQHRLITVLGHQRLGSQLLSRYRFVHIVFQSYLYGNLDATERAYLHEAVGNTLEQLAAERTEAVAGQLAYHFQAAGLTAKAIEYLHEAGRQAIILSAHQETISYLKRALTLLAELPNTDERKRQELRIYTDLGISYKITKGFAANEVEQVYRHAKTLCELVGDSLSWACVLWGYHSVHSVRGEMAAGYKFAQEYLALGQDDPILRVVSNLMAGSSLGHMGRLRAAQAYLELAREAYSPEQHDKYTFLAGLDLGVFTLAHFAHVVGYLGYADQALHLAEESVELAHSLAHIFSQVAALSYLSMLQQLHGDWRAVQATSASALRICIEHDFPYYLAWNNFMQGWALTQQESVEQGIEQMEQSLDDFQALQAGLRRPYYFGLLAEAYGKVGRIKDGLYLTEEALAQAQLQEQFVYEPDIQAVRGELL